MPDPWEVVRCFFCEHVEEEHQGFLGECEVLDCDCIGFSKDGVS